MYVLGVGVCELIAFGGFCDGLGVGVLDFLAVGLL